APTASVILADPSTSGAVKRFRNFSEGEPSLKPAFTFLLLVAFVVPASNVFAASPPQNRQRTDGAQGAARPAGDMDVDTSKSEMRPLIEEFAADRTSLSRAYDVESSRRDRMKEFYADWQQRL